MIPNLGTSACKDPCHDVSFNAAFHKGVHCLPRQKPSSVFQTIWNIANFSVTVKHEETSIIILRVDLDDPERVVISQFYLEIFPKLQ